MHPKYGIGCLLPLIAMVRVDKIYRDQRINWASLLMLCEDWCSTGTAYRSNDTNVPEQAPGGKGGLVHGCIFRHHYSCASRVPQGYDGMLYGGMHLLPRTPESCIVAFGIRAGLKLLVKASVGIVTRCKRSTPAARWFKCRLNRGGSLCIHLVNHENHQHSTCVIGSVQFSWPCGVTYPDVFAAIGVGSGFQYKSATNLVDASAQNVGPRPDPVQQGHIAYQAMGAYVRRVPTIIFHGTNDNIVPEIHGKEVTISMAVANSLADPSFTNTDFKTPSSTVTMQAPVPDGYTYSAVSWSDINGKPVVHFYQIYDMNHAWSGGASPSVNGAAHSHPGAAMTLAPVFFTLKDPECLSEKQNANSKETEAPVRNSSGGMTYPLF
ncbi:hypothetical protein JOM56_010209 [Amanita muscaria]